MEIIIAALIAGATAAAKDTAGQAVKDAYKGLKDLMKEKFKGDLFGQAMVDAKPEDIKKAEVLLKDKIIEAGIDKDDKIIEKAQQIMKEEDPEGASTGKYDLRGAKGVQLGNQNTQTNTFS
jgi:hypothetical protein